MEKVKIGVIENIYNIYKTIGNKYLIECAVGGHTISITNFEYYERMSEETNCFVGDLVLDGNIVGECRNEGRGGCSSYYAHKNWELAREIESIVKAINDELELYPTTCGVAIETTYDAATRELVINTKITSNVASRYKYHIFLVEDGIVYSQSGVNGEYTHNNVVRKMFATDITGLNVNKKAPLTPGVEVVASNKATLERGWNAANMRVVAVAMSSNDGDKTYFCNNANECAIGASVDYIINE